MFSPKSSAQYPYHPDNTQRHAVQLDPASSCRVPQIHTPVFLISVQWKMVSSHGWKYENRYLHGSIYCECPLPACLQFLPPVVYAYSFVSRLRYISIPHTFFLKAIFFYFTIVWVKKKADSSIHKQFTNYIKFEHRFDTFDFYTKAISWNKEQLQLIWQMPISHFWYFFIKLLFQKGGWVTSRPFPFVKLLQQI